MNREAVEKAVELAYAARLANDPGQCVACFADQGEFRLAGQDEKGAPLPCAQGHAALMEALEGLVDIWRWHGMRVKSTLIDGLEVAVRYELTTDHLPSATTVKTEVVDHIQFDDQLKIVAMTEFLDTAMISALPADDTANT